MICRLAVESDIAKIAEFKLLMFEEVGMAHLLMDHFINEVIQSYNELYLTGVAQHFIIEDGQSIIASAGAFVKNDIPYCFYKERVYGFIGDVYVEPLFRQKGYARALTEEAIKWLASREIKTIRLLASHKARHLYESLGFVGTSEMVLNL